jgi:hypothetical protein
MSATTRLVALSIPGIGTPLDRLPVAVAAQDLFILARQTPISPGSSGWWRVHYPQSAIHPQTRRQQVELN